MKPLNIYFSEETSLNNAHIVHFEGDFDGSDKEILKDVQSAIAEMSAEAVMMMDFSQINFMNSFAIGQLVEWHKELEVKNAKLFIAGTNAHVKDIFMVLGVDHILKTFDNLEDAKKEWNSL